VGILQTDPLLNINTTTYTANPVSGTTDPISLDVSGQAICQENPIPRNADCRYVMVPECSLCTTPVSVTLDTDGSGGYQQTDLYTSNLTTNASQSQSLSMNFGVGPQYFQAKVTGTWTRTNSESTGTTTGATNSMNLTFNTNTGTCNENVAVYEDTVYHTFVFQVPQGNYGCP
jgi:hypothetical protein